MSIPTVLEVAAMRSKLAELVMAIRENGTSDAYLAQELFSVLKQCVYSEPNLCHLIDEEISEYKKLASK